jgi:hypothetical protein
MWILNKVFKLPKLTKIISLNKVLKTCKKNTIIILLVFANQEPILRLLKL